MVLPSIRCHSPLNVWNGVWLLATIATETSSPYFREGPFPSFARLNQYGLGVFSFGGVEVQVQAAAFKKFTVYAANLRPK